MINIYVCEDDNMQRKELVDFINGHILLENYDMKMAYETGCPHELLAAATGEKGAIYLLDIDLQSSINGISVAKKIREFDAAGSIIFITSHAELMYLTFEYAIEALGYINKIDMANTKEKLAKILQVANSRMTSINNRSRMIAFRTDDKTILEDRDHILFFEIAEKGTKKVMMYTINRAMSLSTTLTDIEKLDDKFFRAERSLVVNVKNIDSVDPQTNEIKMTNGDICIGSGRGIAKLMKLIK